jgi:hypothetical protein
MSSGFAKNEAKALQNTTNCVTVNLYKRGACVKRAESGLYRPDPKGSAAAVLPEPDLDNANVGRYRSTALLVSFLCGYVFAGVSAFLLIRSVFYAGYLS